MPSLFRPRVRTPVALSLLAGALAALPARAGLVDIVGGFTRYDGPVATNSFLATQTNFLTYSTSSGTASVNAMLRTGLPTFPASFAQGYGLGDADFTAAGTTGPVASVRFSRLGISVPSNYLEFNPTQGASVKVGDTFKVGTFTLGNGGWFGDFPDSYFSFTMKTVSSTPALDGHVYSGRVGFHVTTGCTPDYSVCSTDPVVNADYFYIDGSPQFGYVGVYELESGLGNSGSIDFYARIGSLIPEGFGNPRNVVLESSIPLPGGAVTAAVPEPASAGLLLAGLVAVLAKSRRSKPAQAA